MSFYADNLARFSYPSSCALVSANKSLSTRNYGGELPPSYGGHASSNRTAIAVNFRSQSADENSALVRVCRYVSRLLLGHSFGPFRRPAALGLLLRILRPFGIWFFPKQVREPRQRTPLKLLSGPSQKADLRHLGAGPTR